MYLDIQHRECHSRSRLVKFTSHPIIHCRTPLWRITCTYTDRTSLFEHTRSRRDSPSFQRSHSDATHQGTADEMYSTNWWHARLHRLLELKNSLNAAVKLQKKDAINLLRILIEPSVLVIDEIATKKKIYRSILNILNFQGLSFTDALGVSVITATIDFLFPSAKFSEANERAKELFALHVKGRSRGMSQFRSTCQDNTRHDSQFACSSS